MGSWSYRGLLAKLPRRVDGYLFRRYPGNCLFDAIYDFNVLYWQWLPPSAAFCLKNRIKKAVPRIPPDSHVDGKVSAMCGQFYVEIDAEDLQDIIQKIKQEKALSPVQLSMYDTQPAFIDIRPGVQYPVITKSSRLEPMKWGFALPGGKPLINIRSETAMEKFKVPMAQCRCLVPASGYYEWQRSGASKVKYAFRPPEGAIYMAGCCRIEKGGETARFVILTRAAPEAFRKIHDRMPVVIPRNKAAQWLDEGPDAMGYPVADLICEAR